MDVTVVLCTFNRAARLRGALTDLCRQEMPAHLAWEVLVVDNASIDETRAVTAEVAGEHPGRIRYVHEPRQGKSNALNAGIAATSAPVLAFTDDDVQIDERWLRELVRSVQETDCIGAGGRILPTFPRDPPVWLAANLEERRIRGPLAQFDLGDTPFPLTRAPYGGNVAYRRSAFERYGGFRTDLGPTASNPMGRGEDVELGARLLRAGERLMYAPKAVIHNVIPEERMSKLYFASWWFNHGRATAISEPVDPNLPAFAGMPHYLYREISASAFRTVLSFGERDRLFNGLDLMEHLGRFVEIAKGLWRAQNGAPG